MKKYIIIILTFALLGFKQSNAQTYNDVNYNSWNIQKDSPVVVFVNKAYMRQAASLNAVIVDSFKVGTTITVLEQLQIGETINGVYAPWLKVKSPTQQVGYLWLGLIALKYQQNSMVQFICGISKVETLQEQLKYTIQLKAISADTIADVKEWKIDGGESANFVAAKLLGKVGLKNIDNVCRITFGGEACGIPTNYYYYGWTGNKLISLPSKYSVGDADIYYHTETFIFPYEKGGKPNTIIKIIDEQEMITDATKNKKAKYKKNFKKEIYLWDGVKYFKK